MRRKGAWHLAGAYEHKNTIISSEGLMAIYMKICTNQNLIPAIQYFEIHGNQIYG